MFEFSWCESFPMSWLHMFYPYASDFGIIMGLTYFSGDILISDNCLTYIYMGILNCMKTAIAQGIVHYKNVPVSSLVFLKINFCDSKALKI